MRDVFIIVGCWAISFLFNGIEAGLTSIDPVRLRYHVKLNRPAAVRLDQLLKTPERLLVTVLLVTNFADILALLLLTRLLISRFGPAGFVFTIAIAVPIYLFVHGVLPKSLFRRFPFRSGRRHERQRLRSVPQAGRKKIGSGPAVCDRRYSLVRRLSHAW